MKSKIILISITFLSLFLSLYKLNEVPPCLNSDEIAYGYNAYSIAQTGADEHGNFLPLRLRSFEDFKLPLYTYILIPFVKMIGANDLAVRFPNIILACLFPVLFYSILKKVFDEKSGLVGAFLVSFSPWIYLLSRQAHEGVLCAFLILLGINALLNYQKEGKTRCFYMGNLFIFLSAFAYHPGRIFLFVIAFMQIVQIQFSKLSASAKPQQDGQKSKKYMQIFFIILLVLIPFLLDFAYGANRVNNLYFFNNQGFTLRINEMVGEDGNRFIHNKGVEFVKELTNRFLYQISPEFLTITGDKNIRFGFPGISNINVIEYLFIFIGLYYLFKNKNKYRYAILILLFVSPLVNALTWQEYSLNRTYFMIFPILAIVAYGVVNLFEDLVRSRRDCHVLVKLVLAMTMGAYLFYSFMSWDFYFNHYAKRAIVIRGWQCSNKEMAQYVGQYYNEFDEFYITRKNGQPYIFILFYNQISPQQFLKTKMMSAIDEFGYTQVNSFDKFNFSFTYNPGLKKTAFIGYPEDFQGLKIDPSKVKKIYSGKEEIFWIVENK